MQVLFRLGEFLDPELNARTLALAQHLRRAPFARAVVSSYAHVLLEAKSTSLTRVLAWAQAAPQTWQSGRYREIPVRYDGGDLLEVAAQSGLSVAKVIELHCRPLYRSYATGFAPGFPYLGSVAPELRLPRLASPRPVKAGSVAIAGEQSGIYTVDSPGGWQVLGSALIRIYDPSREDPFLIHPGDRVRFLPAQGEAPPPLANLELLEPGTGLFVEQAGLLDLVVDHPRRGALSFGLAEGGPLDRLSAGIANSLLGNPPESPVLELNQTGPVLVAQIPLVVGYAGAGFIPWLNGARLPAQTSLALAPGDRLGFVPSGSGARGYLSLPGGIKSRQFGGSAGVDLRAQIGRALVAGDILSPSDFRPLRPGFSRPLWPQPARIRITAGIDATPEALQALTQGSFRVAAADRVGIRLAGEAVPGGERLSLPTALGTVQVPPGGNPIILLADRGSLGGYRQVARVLPQDLSYLGQLSAGEPVQFSLVSEKIPIVIDWPP